MKEVRLIVYGGRFYTDAISVYRALDHVHRKRHITMLIHGAAPGADKLAAGWAYDRGVPTTTFPADWRLLGKAAGFIRNKQMLDEGKPTGGVEFPGGTGTANMRSLLDKAGILVWCPVVKKAP